MSIPHQLTAHIVDIRDAINWTVARQVIIQNAIYKSADRGSVIFLGTIQTSHPLDNHEGYENMCLVAKFESGLSEVLSVELPKQTSPDGDLCSAIIVAEGVLARYCDENSKSGKAERHIHVYTGNGAIACVPGEDEATIVQSILTQDLKISHFYTGANRTVIPFISSLGGITYSYEETIQYLSQPKQVRVAPTTKCRVNLSFAGHFQIPVHVYLGVKEETFPTAKWESVYGQDDRNVFLVRTYYQRVFGADPDSAMNEVEVEPANHSKAYLYGKNCIPVEKIQASALKLTDEEKSLSIICSVPETVSSGYWINGVSEVLVEDPTDRRSAQGLHMLIGALRSSQRDLIARYVWRKNAPPRIVLISPPNKYQEDLYLHLNYLPFLEDLMAPPELPNLQETNRTQIDAMNQFVAGASLIKIVKPELTVSQFTLDRSTYEETLDPLKLYNPALHLFHLRLEKELLKGVGNDGVLGDGAEQGKRTLRIPRQVEEAGTRLFEHFPTERRGNEKIKDAEQMTEVPDIDIGMIFMGDGQHVSVTNPLESFEKMIEDPSMVSEVGREYIDECQVDKAIREIKEVIVDSVIEYLQTVAVGDKIVDLLGAVRDSAKHCRSAKLEYSAVLDQLKRIFEADLNGYRSLIGRLVGVFANDEVASSWVVALKELLERQIGSISLGHQLSDGEEVDDDLLEELD